MKNLIALTSSAVAAATLLVSGSAAAQQGQSFHITACNLGCSDGSNGQPIACTVSQVPPNAAWVFEWNDDVDLSSVTLSSIQIIDSANGITPAGVFTLDGPRRVAFTPVGLSVGSSYLVNIRGTAQGASGPFVQSLSGQDNLATLQCVLVVGSEPSNVVSECQTTPNSVGPGALATGSGSSSVGLNDLAISVAGLPPGRMAVPLAATDAAAIPFGDGLLCLAGQSVRLRPLDTGLGSVTFGVDWNSLPLQLGATPGATIRFQLLYRDPAGGPAGFNLSDAMAADLVP